MQNVFSFVYYAKLKLIKLLIDLHQTWGFPNERLRWEKTQDQFNKNTISLIINNWTFQRHTTNSIRKIQCWSGGCKYLFQLSWIYELQKKKWSKKTRGRKRERERRKYKMYIVYFGDIKQFSMLTPQAYEN